MLLFLKDKNEPRHSTEGGVSPEQDTQDASDNKIAEVSTLHFKLITNLKSVIILPRYFSLLTGKE